MSHLEVMVKLHVYLFQTKKTIRKIPIPATISAKNLVSFLTISHILRCYSLISITHCQFQKAEQKERVKSLESWMYCTRYQNICVFLRYFFQTHIKSNWCFALSDAMNMDGTPKAKMALGGQLKYVWFRHFLSKKWVGRLVGRSKNAFR